MSLTAAIADIKSILNSEDWSVSMAFTSPDTLHLATVNGIEATTGVGMNSEGKPINTKHTRITVCEADLVLEGITTRDSRGDVSMLNYLVDYTNKFGIKLNKKVIEQFPDDTLGTITFWLSDYKK